MKLEVPTLQEVLAQNMRRVRAELGKRQDEIAAEARLAGLNWTAVTVATIEGGQRAISAEELLVLPLVFDRPLVQFVQTEARLLRVSESACVLTRTLEAVLSRDWSNRPAPARRAIPYLGEELDVRVVSAIKEARLEENLLAYYLVEQGRRGEAERKAAQALKLDAAQVAAVAWARFGRDLTTERDSRASAAAETGQDARAVRGHITRGLLKEIQEAIETPTTNSVESADLDAVARHMGAVYEGLRRVRLEDGGAPEVLEMILRSTIAVDERFVAESNLDDSGESRARIIPQLRNEGLE